MAPVLLSSELKTARRRKCPSILSSCSAIAVALVAVSAQHGIFARAAGPDDDDNGNVHPFLHKVQPFGYQSTSSKGNDFAASIVKSPRIKQGFFATGTTSGMLLHTDNASGKNTFHAGMHCYLMQIKPFGENWNWIKKIGAFRNDNPKTTTCTSVRTLPPQEGDTETKVVVLGYTEGDVLFNPDDGNLKFSETENQNNAEASLNRINGFAMMVTVPHSEEAKTKVDPAAIKITSGRMLNVEKVTYPISVTAVGGNDVVIVSQVSDETGVNLQAALKDASGNIGDFEPVFRYGQFFKVKVERLSYSDTGAVIKIWSQIFDTDDGRGATVSSVLYDELEDAVTISGTTHGQGDAFGHMNAQTSGTDLDGFVFTLDANSGTLDKSMSIRIESVPGKDEIVSGMCKKVNGEALYIVGSTNAILDPDFVPAYDVDFKQRKLNAFIQKVNINNMKPIWTKQLGSINIRDDRTLDDQDVFGLGCAVDEEASAVYMTGTVSAGGSVVPNQFPTGEQDVFLAGFQSTRGTPLEDFPTVQLGSVMDEYVAKDSGGLTTDQYGNAVLFGTTKGNFIAEKPPKRTRFDPIFADVFFMSFLVTDSEHVSTIETATRDGIMSSANTDEPVKGSASALEVTAISLFASAAIIAIFLLAYKYGKRHATSQIEHQTDQDIARYLEEFEGGDEAGTKQTTNSSGSAANAAATGGMYDISSYYGQNFAMGKEVLAKDLMSPPNEVSLPGGSVGSDLNSADENSTTTYDELMESYKNIMSTTAPSPDPTAPPAEAESPDLL